MTREENINDEEPEKAAAESQREKKWIKVEL